MVSYDLVSMAAILRDFERPKYLDKEHQLLTDIADSLYNVGVNPNDFGAEYKDLYNQYGKAFWDKVLDDMSAIDSQITSDRGARELAADYYDRVGNADFYEDYYGSYEGSSDGYGVYSYRNGQEDSYTYAEDYDEALRYAKWDLTHKNYIDVVRIIDNVTGEIVGEFDSLDSIDELDEGCSPRKRKSSEKKILNQGCHGKRSAKKESSGYRSYTQRQIKDYVKDGLAIDVTNYGFNQMKDLLHSIDKEIVGVSRGTYGVNGVLFKDAATGQFYAVCARNTASQMVI